MNPLHRLTRLVSHSLRIAVLCGSATASTALAVDRTFAHPDRIHYDGHCLTIDGKDTFIYSGAFHYFRCPQPLWPERFAKIKAAGFNTVETYIPWNRSEPQAPAGLDDFSKVDVKEADDFMTMAESYGLNIIIRPGPYICAEWDRGGLPAWLLSKRPAELPLTTPWFRTDDPAYMAWSKHWYDAVCPMIAKHQITRKLPGQPGVILFQIENEYDYSKFPDSMRTKVLAGLSDAAVANGIDVPLFTCWTSCVRGTTNASVARAFDSCNFYVSYGVNGTASDLKKVHSQQPDAPVMVTEQQGGWFTAPTDPMPIHPDSDFYRADLGPSQIQNLELYSIQNGATLTNYYMLFGGTNLGFDDPGLEIATCYDYTASIRENGGVGEKYNRVSAMGAFLAEHGAKIARSDAVTCDVKTDQKDVTVAERRAADGGQYFFIRTSQHDKPRKGTAHVTPHGGEAISIKYDLEPFGSKVLYLPAGETDASHGVWYPKPAAPTARPEAAALPTPVTVHDVADRSDVPPTDFEPVNGKGLVALGIGDRRLIYYQASITLPDGDLLHGLSLVADVAATDGVSVKVNGSQLGMMDQGKIELGTSVHAGKNRVELLYDNGGYANFDSNKTPTEKMERLGGITGIHVIRVPVNAANGGQISGWRMHRLDPATAFVAVPAGMQPDAVNPLPELQPDFADEKWPAVPDSNGHANQLQEHQTAVFRASVDITAQDLAAGRTTLSTSMDDGGWAYVNGQFVGRGTQWDKIYEFDAARFLKPGRNSIAIVVRNESGGGGIGPIGIVAPSQTIGDFSTDLMYSDHSAGTDGHWMDATSADGWPKGSVPETTPSDTAVEWRRLSFELPANKPGTWVPWLLRLHATGSGIMSLNGHPIGRYYHGTPQTDFYLPDCWLNTGPGHANVITMQLHRADVPVAVQAAEVIPYTAYAEKR